MFQKKHARNPLPLPRSLEQCEVTSHLLKSQNSVRGSDVSLNETPVQNGMALLIKHTVRHCSSAALCVTCCSVHLSKSATIRRRIF